MTQIDEKALEAAARELSAWIGYDYDGLGDRDISADYPDWACNGVGTLKMQGGKPATNKAASRIITAYLSALPPAGEVVNLIDRLRYACGDKPCTDAQALCGEAADALERLSARITEAEQGHRDAVKDATMFMHEWKNAHERYKAATAHTEAAEALLAEAERAGNELFLRLEEKQVMLNAATARAERLEAALLSVQRMFRLDLYKQIEDGPHYNQALKDVSNRVNAVLSDSPAPQGDGWVLVPREPTPAMAVAGDEAYKAAHGGPVYGGLDAIIPAFRAMIAATPNKGARDE